MFICLDRLALDKLCLVLLLLYRLLCDSNLFSKSCSFSYRFLADFYVFTHLRTWRILSLSLLSSKMSAYSYIIGSFAFYLDMTRLQIIIHTVIIWLLDYIYHLICQRQYS